MNIIREVSNYVVKKLFRKYTYCIAFRMKKHHTFKVVLPTNRYSYADPFVVEYGGKTAIFVELMDYRYGWGTIGVFTIKGRKISPVREIIREPYHMSFPNVFEHDGELYMMPETYSAGDVHLYKCVSFPGKWEKMAPLIRGVNLVDHAVLQKDGLTYVVSFDINIGKSRVFLLDLHKFKLEEIYPKGGFCSERPGGTFYAINGRIRRVIQDCHECYGDFIRIYEVGTFSTERFEETQVKVIKTSDLPLDCRYNFEHIHQYSVSENYEVVDLFFEHFFVNKLLHVLYRKIIHKDRNFC